MILNRLEQSSSEEAREADEIDEEQPRVIIAGFGRFGQITGRLLLSSGVKMVVLDHDPDHIETLRKFGMKVFYGRCHADGFTGICGSGESGSAD